MDSYLTMMNQIHVLLVDHELPLPAMNTITLLETCQYRVTHVELAMAAMQILTNGKSKFDFIIANINSPDVQAFKLLQLAVSIDIPIIMMSVGIDDDTIMATRVIEIGAFLYIKRPTSIEMIRCLWQHVARDNLRVMREHERLMAANYVAARGIEMTQYSDENLNNLLMMKEKGKLRRKYCDGRGVEEDYDSENNRSSHERVRRKVCIEWTQELHEKFMNAVEQLGEGSCFPKEILELMNVPGLTRMQVASHLQKCRNDNWRSPEERKLSQGGGMCSDGEGGSNQKARRFGLMPRVSKGSDDHIISKSNNDSETNQQQQHGAMAVPHDPNTSSVAGINSCSGGGEDDDILALQEMGCFIHSPFTHPQSSSTNFHFVPILQANSKGGSMESRSQWPTSSETSNFCSNDTEIKTN